MLCSSISGKETIGKIENNDKGKETFELAPVVVLGKAMDYKNGEIEGSVLLSHKVVDLAEILSSEFPEVQMIRKSGYGNEVSLRGFGQENIKVLIDEGYWKAHAGAGKILPFLI
jgi:iron complex outermembrane receptor protein